MAYSSNVRPPPPMQQMPIPPGPPPYHSGGSPLPTSIPFPPPAPPSAFRNAYYAPPGPVINMPSYEPPPPMKISGNMIVNAMTSQPLFTVSHTPAPNSSRENSQFTLIQLPSGMPLGDARRHMSSSSIINVAGRSSKLKHEDGGFSERWKYTPTWSPDTQWYFKNPRKLDLRLLDANHGGRELMTIEKGELRFVHGNLMPGQVGELILAAVVLREDIKEDKNINDEVGGAVLEAMFT